MVFHVLNRGVGRMRLFDKPQDYQAFEGILEETLEKRPLRLCAYCLMPNHWHLIAWPEQDGQLAAFMQRLTTTHVRRWQEHRGRVGYGHLYQSRYKSFPVETDEYFYQVVRYVERNALRAQLVTLAQEWRWGSLWRYAHGSAQQRGLMGLMAEWPLARPSDWLKLVNEPQTDAEVEAIRRAVLRGQPFGSTAWVQQTARRLVLDSTLRAPHRPTKEETRTHAL
jgi:putative transposase